MKFSRAIVRTPASTFAEGVTSATLGAPEIAQVRAQHARYCEALEDCGLTISTLAADARFPDSTFVEDTAIVVGKQAILTRPGAVSRIGEIEAMRPALASHFEALHQIDAPGTVDGGDVCEAGNRFFIGISHRTNLEGAAQLGSIVRDAGYSTELIDIRNMRLLHLKSGLTYLGEDRFAALAELLPHLDLGDAETIVVRGDEEYAANCVRVNDRVLLPAGFPNLEKALIERGYRPLTLDVSEFRKMDGGLSCLSIRF